MTAPMRPEALDECLSAILASPNFTVADYLNTALAEEDAHDTEHSRDMQRNMAELAMQLQLQTQSCHEDIARIGAELQAVLPRCSADVARVGVGLEGLKMDTASLLQATAYESSEVSSSLETLTTLHALQANLTRTIEILTAAATWDETLEQVQQNLAQQNLVEAVHGLAILNKGERALRGMPDPEARVQILDKVRTQVGTLLQPQLSHALAVLHSRVAPLQQCVTLYQQLERMPTLTAEYVKHRPMALHKQWFEYTPPLPVLASMTSGAEVDDNPQLQEQQQQQQQQTTFATWLPGWFDAVLSLVVEERRQATTIFGAALVPEIVVKVFRECFRPILPSFKSRLDSICSSNPDVTKTGSLQEISTIYESMLQFLSLSYETIVGGWLDMVESAAGGSALAQQGPQLYHDLMEIFVFIASPFAEYQRNLPKLEAKYLGEEMQALTKQIQKATMGVNGANVSLDVLQAATDQLQDLSTAVIPLAESAVARFELLNGGYAATPALSAVDRLLAGHASELAIAVHKLSAALRAQEQSLASAADAFDEPHVLCALQVLKVAGKFARGRGALEKKSRERLVLLSARVEAHATKQRQVQEALQLLDRVSTSSTSMRGGKTGSHKAFQLSDSMSIVEIDSLLTLAVCVGESDEESDVAWASLQSLAVKSGDDNSVPPLYPEAEESSKRLTHSCHTFVYEVCSSVPRLYLSGMSSMAAWKEGSHQGVDNFASYGTLPQEYITHVGEHMLALVQALEPFASDKEALALANEVMDGVRGVAQQPWLDFISASGANGSASLAVSLMNGKELEDFLLGGHAEEEEEETEEEDGTTKDVTAFCNAWLDVVGLGVTGRLLERIMRIPFLTPKGCEHLSADLGYLVNVLSALGVTGHPHPLIGHFAELVTMDNQVLAERIASLDRRQPLPSLLRSIEERMLAMRSRSS